MDNDAELLKVFVDETREHLDQLEPDLLALEQDRTGTDLINRIFRAVHSIKGSAGFFGFRTINDLSHVMEDVISRVRDGALAVSREMIDTLLAGKDKLTLMLDDLDHAEAVDFNEEKDRLRGFMAGAPPPAAAAAVTPAAAAPPSPAMDKDQMDPAGLRGLDVTEQELRDSMKGGKFVYHVRVSLRDDLAAGNKLLPDYLKTVRSLGRILAADADLEAFEDLTTTPSEDMIFSFLFATVLEPDLVEMGLEVPAQRVRKIEPDEFKLIAAPDVPAPAVEGQNMTAVAQPAQPAPPAAAGDVVVSPRGGELQRAATASDTIRVSVALLDDLMNLAGEMVLGRNQLLRMAGDIALDVAGLPALLQNINLVTSDLQEKVMHTRMQPVENVFSKFPRIIRDMSKKLEKEIELRMTGQDVELDKSIIEALSDPLTHLIRNCADHAIEQPAEREQAGKQRIGVVHLAAFHEGGQVHIEIADDGRGIDPRKIRDKAVERGMLKPEEAQRLSDREAVNLIFLPGFSTAAKVTDVSGRGVGMDVVKTNIEKLGGTVDLESAVGGGSRVRLRLPLTLAIIPSMIIMAGGRRFAVPQVSLEELVRLDEQTKTEQVRDMDVIRLRGKLLPLVSLADLLEIQPALEAPASAAARYVLVLKHGANRFGLVVDALVGNEEIVVKPLSAYLKKCKFYSGATIMGDGRVAMILDAAGIAGFARLRFADIEKAAALLTDGAAARARAGESQLLVLFRNAPREVFALNLAMINRIEKVRSVDLQRIGGREYLKLRDDSLRVLRLHDFMPVTRPEQEPEMLYVIVPKLVRHPMGIVATRVDDVVETAVALNRENVTGPGILGSAVINGDLTVFLDIYELFEAADPEVYGWKKSAEALVGKRVLLAEDTAFFRAVESEYLREFGCQVDVVNDGVQAWEKLNHQDYDVLVTDIEMPGMNGFELAQRIRGTDKLKQLPIVALTALLAERFVEKGRESGVDAYETKLDKEHLRDTLEKILSRKV